MGDDQQNSNDKVLLLEVQPPTIGVFSLLSVAYDESLLLKEWSKRIPMTLWEIFRERILAWYFFNQNPHFIMTHHLPNLLILMEISTMGLFYLLTSVMFATHLATGMVRRRASPPQGDFGAHQSLWRYIYFFVHVWLWRQCTPWFLWSLASVYEYTFYFHWGDVHIPLDL